MMHMEINCLFSDTQEHTNLLWGGKNIKFFYYIKSGDTGSKQYALIG
jgi:hypothetical protein